MLRIFTYYSNEISSFFIRSMKSVALTIKHTEDMSLIIIAENDPPSKTVKALRSMFDEVTVVQPKLFLFDRESSPTTIPNVNFLETLLLYPDYNRLYVDPRLFMVNSFPFPIDSSLFFKQHMGSISTKLAYLKADRQLANTFSTLTNRSGYKTVTDQSFTYFISNNYLIKKQLFDKQIISAKLFENSGLKSLPTESVVAIDISDLSLTSANSKIMSSIDKLESASRPIFLSGILRRKKEKSDKRTESIIIEKEQFVPYQKEVPVIHKRSRVSINLILEMAKKADSNRKVVSEFKDPRKLTVIIPVYKNASVLATCLHSLVESTSDNFNLLIINDSPFDFGVEELGLAFNEMFYSKYSNSEYVFLTNSENLGFIKTVNRGLSIAKGDVILLNSDTEVCSGWTERMLNYKSIAKVASVTPISNSASQCSFPVPHKNQSHYNGLSPSLIDRVCSRLPMEASHEAPTGVGFCMLMTKEAIHDIGHFDENNFKIGYGEENDWCWRAVLKGYVNIIAPNVYVAHEHGTSFAEVKGLSAIRDKNKQALVKKYPNYFSIIYEHDNKHLLEPIYKFLKYAIDFEYHSPVKKPTKLILGEKDAVEQREPVYSEINLRISDLSFELSANEFQKGKTAYFNRTANSLKIILALIDPNLIEICDQKYLQIPEIQEFISEFNKKSVKTTSSVVVELPAYDKSMESGGITRMKRLVFELPRYISTSGGVRESLKFLDKFPTVFDVSVRFQRIAERVPAEFKNWTVGLPDSTFPACDVCITYSDNPYLSELVSLPQVKKVMLYMLSYGMAIDRERKNVLTPNVTVMCSTKKLEKEISKESVKVHRVGFALDFADMYDDPVVTRHNYLAIMYHPSKEKRYSTAVIVANEMYRLGLIDGVVSFGTDVNYSNSVKPNGLVKHVSNANRDQVREIFNSCKCFLMPSITEGLNLTPIESTLCGCPAVICDGAVDELFFHKQTCFIAEKDNIADLVSLTSMALTDFDKYSSKFKEEMLSVVSTYTWDKVVKNIIDLI